jgi:mono/diheme cytochrome c family protein
LRAVAIAAVLLLAGCAAASLEAPETPAWRGRDLAARACSGCHSVNREGPSPVAGAPPFRTLSEGPDAIQDFAGDIRRHHPDGMPEILLSDAQAADIYAYMRTLGGGDPGARLPPAPPCFPRHC